MNPDLRLERAAASPLADGARIEYAAVESNHELSAYQTDGQTTYPSRARELPARDSNSHDRLNRAASCRWTSWERRDERPDGESNSDLLFDREVSVPVDDRGGMEPVGIEPTHAS